MHAAMVAKVAAWKAHTALLQIMKRPSSALRAPSPKGRSKKPETACVPQSMQANLVFQNKLPLGAACVPKAKLASAARLMRGGFSQFWLRSWTRHKWWN